MYVINQKPKITKYKIQDESEFNCVTVCIYVLPLLPPPSSQTFLPPLFILILPTHHSHCSQNKLLPIPNFKQTPKQDNFSILISSCLTLGTLPRSLILRITLRHLNHPANVKLNLRRKDFTDKAEEKLTPDSQKSLLDKTKEGVTDTGQLQIQMVLPNIPLTRIR